MTGSNILTYAQLIANFPPRPITNDEQYWATQDRIDALLDKAHLTTDEQDYLTALGMMVERYESEHEPDITLRGVRLIRAMMEEQGLKQRDLVVPIFKTDSIASAVLNGKRQLTVEHINKLAAFFSLPHAWFFEPLIETEGAKANAEVTTRQPVVRHPATFVH
jgi:HTH-type transcriptional regulator/antitoxin HigA